MAAKWRWWKDLQWLKRLHIEYNLQYILQITEGTDYIGMGTAYVGMGTDYIGMGTAYVGMGTDYIGMGTVYVAIGTFSNFFPKEEEQQQQLLTDIEPAAAHQAKITLLFCFFSF